MKAGKSYSVRINGQLYKRRLTLAEATQLRDDLHLRWGPRLIVTVDGEGLFNMIPYIAGLCAVIVLTILLLVWFL